MQVLPLMLERLLDVTDRGPFDGDARWLAQLMDAPIALVTVLEGGRQRFAGMHGLDGTEAGADRGTHTALSLCAHVADDGRPLLLENGTRDRRFRTHPAVAELGLRSYLGVPLRLDDGVRIGAVCVADVRTRRWRATDLATVSHVRDVVEDQLAARVAACEDGRNDG